MNIAKRTLTVFLTAILLISLWGAFPLPESKAQAAQPFTVVLNPGHGPASTGSGAVAGGIKESILNEQLTASVVAALKSKGINVIVTNKMTSVGNGAPYLLDERPQGTTGSGNSGSPNGQYHFSNQLLPVIHNPALRIAGMSTPNLLITIHHNATQSSSVKGYEIYYSSALGSHLVPNYNKTSDTIARSIDFANLVNNQFAQPGFYLANRGVIDRENNSLTKYSSVPSILVEAGYMTNASDFAAMRNPANQNILADRLANAVVQYAQKYGNSYPTGTTPVVPGPQVPIKATSVKISKNADSVSLTGVASGVTGGTGGIQEVNFAVWPTNQQNLLKWYKGSTTDGKNFNINVNIRDFSNFAGSYIVHVYAKDNAGNDKYIGGGNVELGVKSKAGSITVSKNTDGASLIAVVNNVTPGSAGVKEVKFAVWPTNKQSLLKWYKGNTDDKKNFNVNVSTRDFSNTGGNYTVHIYAFDNSDNGTYIGGSRIDLASTPIIVKPKATSVKISKNADSISLTGVASDVTGGNGGIKEVNFAVWPTGQQNLLKWYKGSTTDGKNFKINVNIRDFNNIISNYTVHVYARDYASADSYIGGGNVDLGIKPKAGSVIVSKNADGASLTAAANNVTGGIGGIKEVNFAVWPTNKQNLLKWYKGTTTDGKTFKTSVNIKDYSNYKCDYTVHIYAWDNAGNPTFIGGGTVNMGVPITPAKGGITKINVNPANQNEATLMISNVTGGTGGIKEVNFAIWPTNDFGRLRWFTATRSGSNWSVNANISQFGNIYGNYTTHVYAKDNNEDQYYIGGAKADIGGKVNTVSTEKSVYDSSNMTCFIRPGFAVQAASVAVWSRYGGQDDIQWIQASYDASTNQWIANVDLTKFTSAGTFDIHAYGVNNAGVNTFINATTATVKAGAFNGYRIMGASSVTEQQLANYITYKGWNNAWYGGLTANQFAKKYIDICNAEGVKAEVAFAQMCLETNYLKFTGDVRREQYNFAGLGATGGGVPGIAFRSMDDGIKSQVQHLKRYSSTESFKLPIAPEYTRYKLVQPGCAPTVEMLGGKWATGSDYGAKILNMIDQILKTSSVASRMMAAPQAMSVNMLEDAAVEPVETVEATDEVVEATDEAATEEAKPEAEDENQDVVLKEEVQAPSEETEFTPLEPIEDPNAPTEGDTPVDGSSDDSEQQNPSDADTVAPTESDDAANAPENTADNEVDVKPQTNVKLIYLNPLNNQQEQAELDVLEDEPKTDKDAIYAAIAKLIKSDLFKTEVVKVEECDIDDPAIVDEGIKIKVYLSKPLEIPATLTPELAMGYEKAALTSIADMYMYYIDNAKQVEFIINDTSYSSTNLTLGADGVFKELLPNIVRE